MLKIALGDCCALMPKIPAGAVNFVCTDPPYGVSYKDSSGRSIANDSSTEWLEPAFREIYRVLAPDSLAFSFYGWTRVDQFMAAWRGAGFRVVGHVTFVKSYGSSARFLTYRHENGFLLAKGRPTLPANPPPDVVKFVYSGMPCIRLRSPSRRCSRSSRHSAHQVAWCSTRSQVRALPAKRHSMRGAGLWGSNSTRRTTRRQPRG